MANSIQSKIDVNDRLPTPQINETFDAIVRQLRIDDRNRNSDGSDQNSMVYLRLRAVQIFTQIGAIFRDQSKFTMFKSYLLGSIRKFKQDPTSCVFKIIPVLITDIENSEDIFMQVQLLCSLFNIGCDPTDRGFFLTFNSTNPQFLFQLDQLIDALENNHRTTMSHSLNQPPLQTPNQPLIATQAPPPQILTPSQSTPQSNFQAQATQGVPRTTTTAPSVTPPPSAATPPPVTQPSAVLHQSLSLSSLTGNRLPSILAVSHATGYPSSGDNDACTRSQNRYQPVETLSKDQSILIEGKAVGDEKGFLNPVIYVHGGNAESPILVFFEGSTLRAELSQDFGVEKVVRQEGVVPWQKVLNASHDRFSVFRAEKYLAVVGNGKEIGVPGAYLKVLFRSVNSKGKMELIEPSWKGTLNFGSVQMYIDQRGVYCLDTSKLISHLYFEPETHLTGPPRSLSETAQTSHPWIKADSLGSLIEIEGRKVQSICSLALNDNSMIDSYLDARSLVLTEDGYIFEIEVRSGSSPKLNTPAIIPDSLAGGCFFTAIMQVQTEKEDGTSVIVVAGFDHHERRNFFVMLREDMSKIGTFKLPKIDFSSVREISVWRGHSIKENSKMFLCHTSSSVIVMQIAKDAKTVQPTMSVLGYACLNDQNEIYGLCGNLPNTSHSSLRFLTYGKHRGKGALTEIKITIKDTEAKSKKNNGKEKTEESPSTASKLTWKTSAFETVNRDSKLSQSDLSFIRSHRSSAGDGNFLGKRHPQDLEDIQHRSETLRKNPRSDLLYF